MSKHARHSVIRRTGYTLVEMLIVVTMMGLAAAIVIPSLASANTMKVQGALRMIVADITVAQSDAVAFQQNRAIIFRFNSDNSRYLMCEATGITPDSTTGIIQRRYFGGENFGMASITSTTGLAPNNTLVFDALGGPVKDGSGGAIVPAGTAQINISGSNENWRINVEAFTGRVTVQNMN